MPSLGRVPSALYRIVLRLYPSRARVRFGAEQLELFEQTWQEERPRGLRGAVWTAGQLWGALTAAVLWHLGRFSSLQREARSTIPGHRLRSVSAFLRDLRMGVRALRAEPWYSAGVCAVFAVGLTLATVVFALVDGILFKPLPYPRADELFLVRVGVSGAPRIEPPAVSVREAEAWAVAAAGVPLTRIGRSADPVATIGARHYYSTAIDPQFFDVLHMTPLMGGFIEADFAPRAPQIDRDRFPRALISYGFWQTATGGNREIVGRQLPLNAAADRGIRVAGVLPKHFVFPSNVVDHTTVMRHPDVLLPMAEAGPGEKDFPEYLVLARIERGRDVNSVRERFRAATLDLTRNPPSVEIHHDAQRRPAYDVVELEPVPSLLGHRERPAFALVATATALLIGLVCINLAGLTAARSLHHHRDLVIRRALGASGANLARGVLGELVMLAGIATLIALLVSPLLLDWSIGMLPDAVTLLKAPGIDPRTVAATTAVALGSAVLVAVWPALVATRVSAFSTSGHLDVASTRRGRTSGLVVVSTQAALGFMLLTAGGLTLGSIAAAWRNDVGYQRDRVVILEAFLKNWATTSNDAEQVIALHQALGAVPGVHGVTHTMVQMFSRNARLWSGVKPEGVRNAPEGLASRSVSREFFDVMQLPFVDGEAPSSAEWNANRVAVVSQSAARLLWPDRSAIGQRLVPVRPDPGRAHSWRVIAIVRDARYQAVDREPVADLYVPDVIEGGRYGAFFLVRTSDDAEQVIPRLIALAAARGFWTETVMPLDDALFATMQPRFLPAWLFGSFGVVALVILGAGIFGLLAMSAAQRSRELVIRVALGASTARVLGLLARDQMAAVAIGIAAGALVSVWAIQLLQGHLYGVRPHEPAIWAGVALLMLIVSAFGAGIPAAQAARANPADALRVE